MPSLPSFKEMPIWQRSMQLAVEVCQISLQLPTSNKLIVSANLQEAALAIPTTLARGSKGGRQNFARAVMSARQTAAELETLVILMQNLYDDGALVGLLDKTVALQQALDTMAHRLTSESRPV